MLDHIRQHFRLGVCHVSCWCDNVPSQVDATDDSNKELASKFGVRGYPTLKVFRGGDDTNAEDYEGPREADGIIKHVKKISGPASAAVESADAVTAFIESEDAPVVAYFPATEGEQFDAYMKEANVLRNDFSFAHVTDASFLKVWLKMHRIWQHVLLECLGKLGKALSSGATKLQN